MSSSSANAAAAAATAAAVAFSAASVSQHLCDDGAGREADGGEGGTCR
jgi:hypothetical protein